jgi:hypothetical protein
MTQLSNYCAHTAIAKFFNRDDSNAVGFEMRMSGPEYHALSRFLEQMCKDVAEKARRSLADQIRAALPTPAEPR